MKQAVASDYEVLVSSLEDEARADARSEHFESRELLDYQLGELEPAVEEGLRDHLVVCRQCSTRLLELAPLTAPESPVEDSVVDFEMAASWRELQGRIQPPQAAVFGLKPSWVAAAAAVFLLLPAGLAFDGIRLRGNLGEMAQRLAELEAPRANPAMVLVDPRLRSQQHIVELPAEDPFFRLVFTLADRHFANYELRLSSSTAGEPLLTITGLVDDKGSVSARLVRDALPSGELVAELVGLGDGEPQVLQSVQLRDAAAEP